MNITYTTEDPAREYASAIRTSIDKESLVKAIEPFLPAALDAYLIAKLFTDSDYLLFRKQEKDHHHWGIDDPRWPKFTEGFSMVLMPEKMMRATIVAQQMKVPWGLAFIRLAEIDEDKVTRG